MNMLLSPLNCPNRNIKFGNNEKSQNNFAPVQNNQTITGVPLPGSKRLNYSPATIGAINGFCWFGVGMLLDKCVTKFFSTKASTKFSLALQGALGLVMGLRAYNVAKKEAKEA